jgi:hypothetical protein
MSRVRLEAAKELLDQKKFEAARAILETIKDDPIARRWLSKLDTLEITQVQRSLQDEQTKLEIERAYRRGYLQALITMEQLYTIMGAPSLAEMRQYIEEHREWRRKIGLPLVNLTEDSSMTVEFAPLYKELLYRRKQAKVSKRD